MKNRDVAALLEDMKSIFGTSFGDPSVSEAFSKKVKDATRAGRARDDVDRDRLAHAKSIGDAAAKYHADKKEPDRTDPHAAMRNLDRERNAKDMVPHKAKAAAQGGGGRGAAGGGGKSGKRSQHYPFSQSPNLGQGPLGHYHDEKKCWICSCGNIYTDGCWCFGNPRNRACKDNKPKRVRIKRAYRKWYNGVYHKWRRNQRGGVTARLQARGASKAG